MPSLSWNGSMWDRDYAWPEAGEEWSELWGNSEAQWYGSLFPRLHRLLPAPRILEIAPGHGRWTRFLIPSCSEYLGIDLSPSCVEICSRRFATSPNARFAVNDGLSLEAAHNGLYDLVFSFDSLVHAELDIFGRYVPEILAKLTPSGAAFIHHSNLADATFLPGQHGHSRAGSVSASTIRSLVAASGGETLLQEVVSWHGAGPIDCLTIFAKAGARPVAAASPIVNMDFNEEARMIRAFQAPYATL